jgi:hypothetical protein
VWRRILQARFIVRGGARWRIGSGATIPILREPWLSDDGCIDGNYDVFHDTGGPSVQSLIDTIAKGWKVDVIQHVFSPEDTRRILDTPLIDQVTEDRLVWKAEKNGYYFVKSSYRLCVDVLTYSSYLRRGGYWQGIWRLKVHLRLKIWFGIFAETWFLLG